MVDILVERLAGNHYQGNFFVEQWGQSKAKMAMSVQSEMQEAEREICAALEREPGQATELIYQSYARRGVPQRDAFVVALIARVVVSQQLRR